MLTPLNIPPEQNTKLIDRYFQCGASTKKIGEGFYGSVYLATLPKEPCRAVIKWYKLSDNNQREASQLNLLRKHSFIKVPEVFAIHQVDGEIPVPALVMEFIEGVNASLLPTDHPNAEKFADQMVTNLVHLHQVRGECFGAGYSDWYSCLREKIGVLHTRLHSQYEAVMAPEALRVADQSYQKMDLIFSEPVPYPSLIHSDYNLWNLLADPKTAKITAVIDPLDAGWADSELDLFHLQNAGGDRFGLLDRYREYRPLSSLFPLKNRFYWFWDDIKHMVNLGWYEQDRFLDFAGQLKDMMERYL